MRSPTELGRYGCEDRPHRLRGASLFTDHLADVFLRDSELDEAVVLTRDLGDDDLVGVIDQLHRNRLDQLFQCHSSLCPGMFTGPALRVHFAGAAASTFEARFKRRSSVSEGCAPWPRQNASRS